MDKLKFLTREQKTMFLALFTAVMDDIEDETRKEKHDMILDAMKKHEGDIERYAMFGYLTAMVMKDISESMADTEEEEYKIIG